jgi:hypothetical protein
MGCSGRKVFTDVPYEKVEEARYNILHQLVSMEKYVEKHHEEIMGPKPSQEYFHTVAKRATHTP